MRPIVSLLCVAALCAGGASAQPSRMKDWDENGEANAQQSITACLSKNLSVGSNSSLETMACAYVAMDDCVRDTTDQQLNLNRCSAYSRRAWEARYKELMDRIENISTRQRRGPTSQMAGQLISKRGEWESFVTSDCQARAGLYRGGSIQTLILNSCLGWHYATRTADLFPNLEYWEDH